MNIHNHKILETMKLKHFLLGIALTGCCGIFLTSCTQDDDMGLGGTTGGGDPNQVSQVRSQNFNGSSLTNEKGDSITVTSNFPNN